MMSDNSLSKISETVTAKLDRYTEESSSKHKIKMAELYKQAAEIDYVKAKEGKDLLNEFFK
jgi:hypothetical protein